MNKKVKLFVPLAATMAILAACGTDITTSTGGGVSSAIETEKGSQVEGDANILNDLEDIQSGVAEESTTDNSAISEVEESVATESANTSGNGTSSTPTASVQTTPTATTQKGLEAVKKTVSSVALNHYTDFSSYGTHLGTTDAVAANSMNKSQFYTNVKYVGKVKYLVPNRMNQTIGAIVEVSQDPENLNSSVVYVDFTKANGNDYNPADNIDKDSLTGKYIYFEGKIDGFNNHFADDGDENLLVPSVDLSKIEVSKINVVDLNLEGYTNVTSTDSSNYYDLGYFNNKNDNEVIYIQLLNKADYNKAVGNPPKSFSSVIKVAEYTQVITGKKITQYKVVK